MIPLRTIEWLDGKIRIIDQTSLPSELVYLDIETMDALGEAIKSLRVRGAPAIGIAAAMGVALAAHIHRGSKKSDFQRKIHEASALIRSTRPTAVNLFWALDRMRRRMDEAASLSVPEQIMVLTNEAVRIWEEDRDICRRIGIRGAELLPPDATVITHCNAGALATADFGTALGVLYAAVEAGKRVRVFADETRPLLQGARLTAWELSRAGIPVTVICDSAAAAVMRKNRVDAVIVGADRIAANGDTANKIGTYGLSVLAQKHAIPFYVAAPLSTVDPNLSSGEEIPIEERNRNEIAHGFGIKTVPDPALVYNPAFDVTPNELIAAIITEHGVLRPPFGPALATLTSKSERQMH